MEQCLAHLQPRDVSDKAVEVECRQDDELEYPGDHGSLAACLVLAGSFLTLFPSYGFMVSAGTLQEYLEHHQLSQYTTSEVGWIPSVYTYLSLALGLLVGPILDRHQPRWLLLAGSLMQVVMIFALAECKLYWQFLLCMGCLGGFSGAILSTTGLWVLGHWFKTRRGTASGIAMVGNSFGGVVFPLVLRNAIPRYGYAWAIRIIGFIFVASLTAANLLVKPRIPPSPDAKKHRVMSLELYSQPSFSFFTASLFGIEMVLFGSLGIIPTYATSGTGYPASTGYYIIAVMNGTSCLGRILPGLASDVWGRFNVLGISMVATLVIMLAVWLPFGHTSVVALYVFAALYGFGTGCWMAMMPACLGQLSGPHHFGRYFGTSYFLASLATLVGIPIAGQLENVGPQALIAFMAAMLALSTGTLAVSRWASLGWRWKWCVVI